MKKIGFLACLLLVSSLRLTMGAETPTTPWSPDLGDGTYKNPIIFADYSDPDVVRVGTDYYLVSSSFTCVPGLPILHSKDLVNWTIIGHALMKQVPEDIFNVVQSGKGVWAPSIRFHDGKFYIFYPDPDYGIYVVTATDPAGGWSAPILVKAGRGLEDPCPLWDDDGKVYLVHGLVGSRIGRNNALVLNQLSPDATKTIDAGHDIIAGTDFKVTALEGPKFYKMNGYYWIFAPVNGVGPGSQAVFRAKDINGPYEMRLVLSQGGTKINGPHQGGLVDSPNGKEWWFIHFQDMAVQKGAEGRVDHLEPVVWNSDGWPVMGNDPNHTGTGEPVTLFKKPNVGQSYPAAVPQTSDDFASPKLGLQWQWLANPQTSWYSLTENPHHLRLYAQEPNASLVRQPNLLLQKIPAPTFSVSVKMTLSPGDIPGQAGLVIYGAPCATISVSHSAEGFRVSQVVSTARAGANPSDQITETTNAAVPSGSIYLAFNFTAGSRAQFSYSSDGAAWTPLGPPVSITAIRGSWIGAKFGLFALMEGYPNSVLPHPGYADFDWIRVTSEAGQ